MLVVNCLCEDGYIDGLESPNRTFYMAFRFHPESLYKIDENHNKIFEEFIKICKGMSTGTEKFDTHHERKYAMY